MGGVCGVGVIRCFWGGSVPVMGGVSTGCVNIEGVVFYNRPNTYLVVLAVVGCGCVHRISCILLVSLSSPYINDARSQEPKT